MGVVDEGGHMGAALHDVQGGLPDAQTDLLQRRQMARHIRPAAHIESEEGWTANLEGVGGV